MSMRIFSVVAAFALAATLAQCVHAQDVIFSERGRGSASITSGSITGITDLAVADGGTGASTAQLAAQNLGVPWNVCQSAVQVSTAADTNENTAYTCAIPAGSLGANGRIYYFYSGAQTNNANAKTIKVKYGGTTLVTRSAASAAVTGGIGMIANRNLTNSQHGGDGVSAATSAIDSTAAQNFTITFQKATAGDTMTLESVLVQVLYGL